MSMEGTTPRSRFWLLITALLVLIIVPFCIWGGWFEQMLDLQGAKRWMESLGLWAWLGGIALLLSDLVLPIPSTVVMSALGLAYGWFWGGVVSVAGSVLSGIVAYGLCLRFGRKPAVWLAGEAGLAKARPSSAVNAAAGSSRSPAGCPFFRRPSRASQG